MRLTRFSVKNFRSIETLLISPRDLTSLIGPNNSGKSSVLYAIRLFLEQVKPEPGDWRKGHEGEAIIFEAILTDLEDWERDRPGVSGLVQDDQIQVRASYQLEDPDDLESSVDATFECRKREETIEGWPEDANWGDLDDRIQEVAVEAGVPSGRHWGKNWQERVRQHIRDNYDDLIEYGEKRWTSQGVSIPTAFQQAFPNTQFIPAVTDATEESQAKGGTLFNELLQEIIVPAIRDSEEFQELLDAADALDSRLQGKGDDELAAVQELRANLTKRLSSLLDARVRFGLNPPDASKYVGKSTRIELDDGGTTDIERQGHGLRRALVFAILELIASRASSETLKGKDEGPDQTGLNVQRSVVLLFEEPELYIHPHLMDRLVGALRAISQHERWQVLLSTHSPFLVDVGEDPMSLVIHRREDSQLPPRVQQLKADPFEGDGEPESRERLRAVLRFHPTCAQAFFAEHVVLVEGDTELAVLTQRRPLISLADLDPEADRDITVISCDGKWTIPPMARILTEFEIPFRIIHDRDAKGRAADELAGVPGNDAYAVNERIDAIVNDARGRGLVGVSRHVVDDTFEDVLWADEDNPTSDKPFKAWRRAANFIEEGELPDDGKLRDVIRFAFEPFPEDDELEDGG